MDILGLVDLPGWLLGIIMFVVSICIYTRYKQTYFTRNGYAQRDTTFFIGDFYELSKKGLGYLDVSCVKKYGKVFGQYFGNKGTLIICDAEMIKHIFVKEFSNFTERGNLAPLDKRFQQNVSVAEGIHWKFLRNILSPTFSSGKMRQMKPLLKKCLDEFHGILEENVEKGEYFDFTPILHGFTMDVICSTGFGIEVNSQKEPDSPFIKHSKEFLNFRGTRSLSFMASLFLPDFTILHKIIGPTTLISKKAWAFFDHATRTAFEERKKSSSAHKDLLQLMINAHKDSTTEKGDTGEEGNFTLEDYKKRGLTDDEVLMNSLIFMVAGFDTTATTLSWLVYDMMIHPEVQAKLREEIDSEIGQDEPTYDSVFKMEYLDMVVNETLRMNPPATRLARVASNDTEICGVKIPKDLFLGFLPLILHFMEEYWDKPNEYIPERFAPENKANINEYAYMPFGLGPRNCIGMRLALLEVKTTLVSILQRYIIHRSDKLQVPMTPSTVGLHKPKEPLYVRLEKRKL